MRLSWTTAIMISAVANVPPGLGQTPKAAGTAEARAVLRDPAGSERGWARLVQSGADVQLRLEANSLSRGLHGVHIHDVGRCDAPDFTSAGGHWNPAGSGHGKYNPKGQHLGDLPNLIVESTGRGTLIATLTNVSIGALRDADGSAIIVAASADDYRTDPDGNSGRRLMCGVLQQ